jgi:hypothetical protein
LFILLRYWGVEADYQEVLNAVKEYPPEEGGYDPTCQTNQVCTSLQVVTKVAQRYAGQSGLVVEAREGWALNEIFEEHLLLNRPVMVNYGGGEDPLNPGQRLGIGHSVVIYGMDRDLEKIYVVDPYPPHPPYGTFGFGSFGLMWENSDYGDPLRRNGEDYDSYTNWALVMYREEQE